MRQPSLQMSVGLAPTAVIHSGVEEYILRTVERHTNLKPKIDLKLCITLHVSINWLR